MSMPKRAPRNSSVVELGYVSGIFGTRGEVRLFLHNLDAEWVGGQREVELRLEDGSCRRVMLAARRGTGKRVLGRIDGVTDPDQARLLVGARIEVDAAELPVLDEDEFYLRDLLGAKVTLDGEVIGTVKLVHQTGPIDIFELTIDGDSVFVPALHEFIDQVGPDGLVLRELP